MNMKALLLSILIAITASFGGCISQAMPERADTASAPAAADQPKPNVLVELFTSEGCSSCPPADKVLSFLGSQPVVPNANIITLGFHVDYWDTGGWRDRFSSNLFTKRQEAYARGFGINSTYTPQMVIDGSAEFVGSDSGRAVNNIGKLAAQPKGEVSITIDGGKLRIKADKLPVHGDATIYLAVAEDKLSSSVSGGENAGNKLEHSSVVRQLMLLGTAAADQSSVNFDQSVPTDPAWKRENLKYVVFVQDNTTLKIIGVGQAS
jgi:hypothetical protein